MARQRQRWTAVDKETGEIFEYPSRNALRKAVRENPVLRGREREHEPLLPSPQPAPKVRAAPLWASQHWTAETVSMKHERAFDNATAGMRFAFLKAVTARDAEAATRIRSEWERNVKAYAEGRMDANTYSANMKEVAGWLFQSPYAPPVAIWYHEGSDDSDDYSPADYPDWEDEEEEYEE